MFQKIILSSQFNITNVTLAAADALTLATTGLIPERSLLGYKNGIYFHPGGQTKTVKFAGDPSYT